MHPTLKILSALLLAAVTLQGTARADTTDMTNATDTAPADTIAFTPFAGYTTVTMGSIDKQQGALAGIYQLVALSELSTASTSMTNTDMSSAWIVGGDLLTERLTPCNNLSLGLRVEYLATNPANDILSATTGGEELEIDQKQNGTLTGLLLGGRYQLPGADWGLKLSVGAFGGLAYGTIGQSFTAMENGVTLYRTEGFYQGEGFMADMDLRLDWTIPHTTWLHLTAQGGYRYASLGQLSGGNGQVLTGGPAPVIHLLDPSLAVQGNPVDADFSGLTAEGGLSVVF